MEWWHDALLLLGGGAGGGGIVALVLNFILKSRKGKILDRNDFIDRLMAHQEILQSQVERVGPLIDDNYRLKAELQLASADNKRKDEELLRLHGKLSEAWNKMRLPGGIGGDKPVDSNG